MKEMIFCVISKDKSGISDKECERKTEAKKKRMKNGALECHIWIPNAFMPFFQTEEIRNLYKIQ